MADRIQIVEAFVASFEAYSFTNLEGFPDTFVPNTVVVKASDGRDFYMPNYRQIVDDDGIRRYISLYQAENMVDRVNAMMTIDPDYWVESQPAPSLEERYAMDMQDYSFLYV